MILTNFLFFVVVVAPMASSGWKNWLNLPKIQHLSRNVAVCRVVHTVTRCRRHNGSIEALPLLARFGETIERANGFVAACSLFANRPCIRNYWSKGVVKPHPKISALRDTIYFYLVQDGSKRKILSINFCIIMLQDRSINRFQQEEEVGVSFSGHDVRKINSEFDRSIRLNERGRRLWK